MYLADTIPKWMRHLKAANRTDATQTTYKKAADQFIAWYETEYGHPPAVDEVTTDDINGWMGHLIDLGRAPTTRLQRFTSLQQWWKYLTESGAVDANPMDRVPRPKAELPPVPVMDDDHIVQLLEVCDGTSFEDRRDTAIIRLFLDTGCRLSEMAGIKVEHLDEDNQQVQVLGKGQRHRWVYWSPNTATALDRYSFARARHKDADEPWQWLGLNGKLSASGIAQMLKRRSRQAGIPHVHPHLFRHFFAHQFLLDEGSEGDLMAITGWSSRQMVDRYGRSAAGARAKAAHRLHSPGNRF